MAVCHPGLSAVSELPRIQSPDSRSHPSYTSSRVHAVHGEISIASQAQAGRHAGELQVRSAVSEFRPESERSDLGYQSGMELQLEMDVLWDRGLRDTMDLGPF